MQSDTAGLSASIFLSVLGSAALAGLSRVAHNGTDAEASLTSGRRPSGVGGYNPEYHVLCRQAASAAYSVGRSCQLRTVLPGISG